MTEWKSRTDEWMTIKINVRMLNQYIVSTKDKGVMKLMISATTNHHED